MRRKSQCSSQFENLKGWTAGVREEMVSQGAAVFSQIHVKSVKRTQFGCWPAKQNTSSAIFSTDVAKTYSTLHGQRRKSVGVKIPHFLDTEIQADVMTQGKHMARSSLSAELSQTCQLPNFCSFVSCVISASFSVTSVFVLFIFGRGFHSSFPLKKNKKKT